MPEISLRDAINTVHRMAEHTEAYEGDDPELIQQQEEQTAALRVVESFLCESEHSDAVRQSLPTPYNLSAVEWIERARETLRKLDEEEERDELGDAIDDLNNALQMLRGHI
jgi:hypothetical protein